MWQYIFKRVLLMIPTLFGAALVTAPWVTLLGISILYIAMLPFSIASYDRVKRRRASAAGRAKPAAGGSAG